MDDAMTDANDQIESANWRPMVATDIGAVNTLANRIHTNYPEDEAVFEEKFRLFPYGCFTLYSSTSIAGYCFSHPWTKGTPPELDAMMIQLPIKPSTYFIHDVAISENRRGRGDARFLFSLLLFVTRLFRLDHMTLISVNKTEVFWQKLGFKETNSMDLQKSVRAKYSDEATHMEMAIEPYF